MAVVIVAVSQESDHPFYIVKRIYGIVFRFEAVIQIGHRNKKLFADPFFGAQLGNREVIYPEIDIEMLHHQQQRRVLFD